MKRYSSLGLLPRIQYELMMKARWLWGKSKCSVFAQKTDVKSPTISAIHVINLDRHKARWENVQRELQFIVDREHEPLTNSTRRFSAVDARSMSYEYTQFELETYYSLADQLFVEPDPRIPLDLVESNQHIGMSPQEIAVALSHIKLWEIVASDDHAYALILEDDIYFRPGFSRILNTAWNEVTKPFDVFYLSYAKARCGIRKENVTRSIFRALCGLWQLSGYVLSKQGALKLLDRLPVRGPVDLWINKQFRDMDVYATFKSIIDQRPDCASSNSYSILPILSKVGVLEVGPSLFETTELIRPVFAFGNSQTGLTSLATALSLLGYRCCSDLNKLPVGETRALMEKDTTVFDAYVNVGTMNGDQLNALAKLYPTARFIHTTTSNRIEDDENRAEDNWNLVKDQLERASRRILNLSDTETDKWRLLCRFLNCNLPACEFPRCEDLGQRTLANTNVDDQGQVDPDAQALRFDTSPWIVQQPYWRGIPIQDNSTTVFDAIKSLSFLESPTSLCEWRMLKETFPSNLALFQPQNLIVEASCARIKIQKEDSNLRPYSSASIASRESFRFGRFSARLKPPPISGLITGIFLHRNSPRQEIDIELLGKDTTKVLLNVFYNPGSEGTKFDYGYRGTPVLLDLGFDASEGFHKYTIEWLPSTIRWFVDERLLYERHNWGPTPIPHMPMEFFLNCWPSRSQELAGKLNPAQLPAFCDIKCVDIQSVSNTVGLAGSP